MMMISSLSNAAPALRRHGVAMLATAAVLMVSGLSSAQSGGESKVDQTREALDKWVETRRVISKEKQDWALGKEMLNDRIALVKREIDSLRGKIDDAAKSITEADKKKIDLDAENEKLEAASASLSDIVVKLETRTKALLKRLPEPVRDRVQPLSQRIPEKPDDTKLSLSERFQNVVGILNEVNKFNRNITITSEVRKLGDGATAEVTALYIGIGQAYYVSADGKAAGVGRATDSGWTWTPADDAAPAIAKAIAILKNEQVAAFVQLPVQIQ